MAKLNLFGEVLNGKKDVSDFDNCSLEEITKMINSAASRLDRISDATKYAKAKALDARLKELREELKPKKAGVWRNIALEQMTLEQLNKAVKNAQSFKCTYGLNEVAKWKAIGRDDERYAWATHNLEVAPAKYQKAIEEEDLYSTERARRFPFGDVTAIKAAADAKEAELKAAAEKVNTVKNLIDQLKAKKKPTAADLMMIDQLSTLL